MTKNKHKPQQPKFAQNLPETCLPYIHLSQVVGFKSPDLQNNQRPKQVSTSMLGEFLLGNYTLAPNGFVKSFLEYQDQHAMGSLRDKLKAGMDEISCDYIDLHEFVLVYYFEPSEHNFNEMGCIFRGEIDNGHVKPVKLGLGNQATTMQLSKTQGQVDSMASVKQDYK